MENNVMMQNNGGAPKGKKTVWIVLGIVLAAVILIAGVGYGVATSPKVLLGTLVKNADDAAMKLLEPATGGEKPLCMTESHQSESKLSMKGDTLGMDGDMELEIMTGYLNSTGDLLYELQLGLADLDAVDLGMYLSESEIAIISSLMENKYVIDLELEGELGKNTTLEERLMNLSPYQQDEDDEKLQELVKQLEKKVNEYGVFALKQLPKGSVSKGKDSIEILGEDQKVSYVEIVLDEDEFKDWAEVVLEKAADDDELEDLLVDLGDYIADEYNMEDEIDTDDIDLEEDLEDAIDDLDDVEIEIETRIYYKGFEPIAYEIKYTDEWTEAEILAQMYSSGDKKELLFLYEDEWTEMFANVQSRGDEGLSVVFDADDVKLELEVENEGKGTYDVSGSFDDGWYTTAELSGEIVETKDGQEFELEVTVKDDDYLVAEVKAEGSKVEEGSITTLEATVDVADEYEDLITVEIEMETEEIKKNKEYVSEGEIVLKDVYSGQEYAVDLESSVIYGSEADVDMPSWSKNDMSAKASDTEAIIELFEELGYDLEDGFYDAFESFMYGGIY